MTRVIPLAVDLIVALEADYLAFPSGRRHVSMD